MQSSPEEQAPGAQLGGTGGSLFSPGEWLSRSLERHPHLSIVLLLCLVFFASASVSHVRHMWFDELFTMLLATQPTWHDMALAMPADANPPLLPMLVRGLVHILGPTELAARLPSMLAFVAACGLLYTFVRRRCGVVAGLFAVCVVLSQPAWVYSFEARSYALLLAFLMLTLFCWQRATEPGPRAAALAGMSFAIAAAMLSHQLGLAVVGFPILLGELVRLARRRRPDWPLYATFLIAVPVLAFTLPMIHRTRAQLLTFSIRRQPKVTVHVMLDWLRGVKYHLPTLISEPVLIALAVLIVATWRLAAKPESDRVPPSHLMPAHEVAAAAGAALLIPVTLVLLMFSSNYYNVRYGIGCVLGFAILSAVALARNLPGRRDVTVGLSVLLLVSFGLDVQSRRITEHTEPRIPVPTPPYSNEPVATTDPFLFMQGWWYGTPEQRANLHFLFDMKTAVNDNDAIPEASLSLERGRFAAHLDRFEDFVASHDHFVAFVPGGLGSHLGPRLTESGFKLTEIGPEPTALFEASREIAPVHPPN